MIQLARLRPSRTTSINAIIQGNPKIPDGPGNRAIYPTENKADAEKAILKPNKKNKTISGISHMR